MKTNKVEILKSIKMLNNYEFETYINNLHKELSGTIPENLIKNLVYNLIKLRGNNKP